jgi:hypothetical protein
MAAFPNSLPLRSCTVAFPIVRPWYLYPLPFKQLDLPAAIRQPFDKIRTDPVNY